MLPPSTREKRCCRLVYIGKDEAERSFSMKAAVHIHIIKKAAVHIHIIKKGAVHIHIIKDQFTFPIDNGPVHTQVSTTLQPSKISN